MYNCLNKNKIVLIFWLVFLWIGNSVLWFDLADEISATFQKNFNWWYADPYLETPYAPSYSKDPFKDAVKDLEDMSMQLKIAWAESVQKALEMTWCSMEQKKIWSILYFFVPEFRAELVRTLKVEAGDYVSRNFTFNESEIYKYCTEYYACMEMGSIHTKDKIKEEVTTKTAQDVTTNCKEFFQKHYKEWSQEEKRRQNVQASQLWNDKYWNATTDDSPYDIMTDFGVIWRLLYTEAEAPITPVLYKLPLFSNSKNSLKKHKENWSSYPTSWKSNDNKWNDNKWNDKWWWTSGWWGANWGGWSSTEPTPLPLLPGSEWWDSDDYDDLIEWLWINNVRPDGTLSRWNPCDDSQEEEDEPEDTGKSSSNQIIISNGTSASSSISAEEFQEVVDYMKSAVDKYAALTPEKEEEMKERAWDTSEFLNDTSASDLKRTADKIKDCWQWCEWLRVDQYASCLIMCTCGEIDSPIFNPDDNPWLWPIFKIRFCAVPGVDTRFALWGRKMNSVEEWIKEIYGVVDKLAREWRLWMWTQQYNFLDSSTKKMNVSETVAFTISMEFVDISDNYSNNSDQYNQKEIKKQNKSWMHNYRISNDLNNPVSKNYFALLAKQWETNKDYSDMANAEWTKQAQSNTNEWSSSTVDLQADSRASHYSEQSQLLNKMFDQQWKFWQTALGYVKDLTNASVTLRTKPPKKT